MISANSNLGLTRFRSFSLRTGLILLLLLCIAFGLAARWIQSVRERGEAQLWLVQRTEAYYEQNENPSAFVTFIRKWIHPEYNRKLDALALTQCDEDHLRRLPLLFNAKQIVITGKVDAAAFDRVFQTPGLKMLNLGCQLTNTNEPGHWSRVKQATALEWIELREERSLPDSLMEEIAKLPNLKRIRVDCDERENMTTLCMASSATVVEFQGSEEKWMASSPTRRNPSPTEEATQSPPKAVFDELAKRSNLLRLSLMHIEIKDPAALGEFCEQSKVTEVELVTRISPECLTQIAKLKYLNTLALWHRPLTDDHIRVLKTMTNLKSLKINPQTPPEMFEELQQALPNCTIGNK